MICDEEGSSEHKNKDIVRLFDRCAFSFIKIEMRIDRLPIAIDRLSVQCSISTVGVLNSMVATSSAVVEQRVAFSQCCAADI